LNAAEQIAGVDSVEADDVGSAMILADRLVQKKHPESAAVEVWQGERCVGKLLRRQELPIVLRSLLHTLKRR